MTVLKILNSKFLMHILSLDCFNDIVIYYVCTLKMNNFQWWCLCGSQSKCACSRNLNYSVQIHSFFHKKRMVWRCYCRLFLKFQGHLATKIILCVSSIVEMMNELFHRCSLLRGLMSIFKTASSD